MSTSVVIYKKTTMPGSFKRDQNFLLWSSLRKASMSLFRCTITGHSKIGKTALATSIAGTEPPQQNNDTIFDNFSGQVQVNNEQFTISVFDTAGEVTHKDIRQFCYDNSDVIIVTYSVASRASFLQAQNVWLPEAMAWRKHKKCAIQLVGLQADRIGHERTVTRDEAELLVKKFKLDSHHTCSVNENTSVQDIFQNTVKLAIKKQMSLVKRVSQLLQKYVCVSENSSD